MAAKKDGAVKRQRTTHGSLGKLKRVPLDAKTCEDLRVERILNTSHQQGGPIIKNRRPRRNGELRKPSKAPVKRKTGKQNVVARIYRKIEVKASTALDTAKPAGQNLLPSDPTARPRMVKKLTESAE